jgi:hypothetical protein
MTTFRTPRRTLQTAGSSRLRQFTLGPDEINQQYPYVAAIRGSRREAAPRARKINSTCKSVNLTPGVRESVPDRDFDVFVPRVVNTSMVDDDIFVRRKRKPNMDLESGAMAMLVARRDNGYATSRDALIVSFQPFDLF